MNCKALRAAQLGSPAVFGIGRCCAFRVEKRILPKAGFNKDIPEELKGLTLREDGLLIDGRTGEVINEYGATRFDVATRALRGEFDPPEGVPNTERNDGLLLDSLIKWPATYEFQFVLRSEGALADIVLEEYRALVSRTCEVQVDPKICTIKTRMGGKYVSLTIPAIVRAPGIIQKVFAAVENDKRIVMKF